jgi:hypothetical protein
MRFDDPGGASVETHFGLRGQGAKRETGSVVAMGPF